MAPCTRAALVVFLEQLALPTSESCGLTCNAYALLLRDLACSAATRQCLNHCCCSEPPVDIHLVVRAVVSVRGASRSGPYSGRVTQRCTHIPGTYGGIPWMVFLQRCHDSFDTQALCIERSRLLHDRGFHREFNFVNGTGFAPPATV
eukprot:1999937-Prymnesium_polylepis.1